MEFLGLALGFGLFVTIAAGAGFVLLLLTWLLVRPIRPRSAPVLLTALLLPPACVVWLYVGAAALPHQSLFGDIDEPLPNGYRLQALGKMPDFATIDRGSSPLENQTGLSQCIGSVQVQDRLVAGQYSHPFGTFEATLPEPYFLLDTSTGSERDFPTREALQDYLKQPLQLQPVTAFRSHETSARLWAWFDRIVLGGAMLAGLVIYVLLLLWTRRSRRHPTSTA